MRFALLSDLHFGDENARLTFKQDGKYLLCENFNELKEQIKPVDFLILMGDVFDFSISGYAQAYEAASPFFRALVEQNITQRIIFVPGNHDFEFWNCVETEVNVINQLKAGKAPQTFNWSVPCIIDDRKPTLDEKINLVGVHTNDQGQYGGLFLDGWTAGLTFYVAHPNIYFIDKSGQSTLITHGQYFEAYWSFLSEVIPKVFDDIEVKNKDRLTVSEMVALNYPSNQLSCSGVGLSGPFRKVAVKVQSDIYLKGHSKDLDRYFKNGSAYVYDNFKNRGWFAWPVNFVLKIILSMAVKKFIKMTSCIHVAQANDGFLDDEKVKERFKAFYTASLEELRDIKGYSDILPFSDVIFGHTHLPVSWSDKSLLLATEFGSVPVHNSGGWLNHKDSDTIGAEVFIYDSSKGMYSFSL